MLKISSTRLHALSQPLSKSRDSLVCSTYDFPVFSPVRILIQKLFLVSDEAFKKAWCIAPQT